MGVVTEYKSMGQLRSYNWRVVVGLAFILSGGMALTDQLLHIHWLIYLAPAVSGLILLYAGIRTHRRGYLISGPILLGLGGGIFLAFLSPQDLALPVKLGMGLLGLSFGFAGVTLVMVLLIARFEWWALIPFGAIISIAMPFVLNRITVFDFVLYAGTGTGFILLAVGVYKKLIGLIIPGCLLIGIGPGIAIAWMGYSGANALAPTGTMLVWFALGWGLITLFSRTVIDQFVWWPLIPGGILAMVGGGLYIGGNPGNAVSFIGNTGSIVMIIFGLYLLLMRRGIRR